VSSFVLDASYALAWCFSDRSTPNTDAALQRLEARIDNAIVPWLWQVEVGNALGKAVTRAKMSLPRALDIWAELLLLPIRQRGKLSLTNLTSCSFSATDRVSQSHFAIDSSATTIVSIPEGPGFQAQVRTGWTVSPAAANPV
jgi:predicted nucleic acid-binding protein